MLSPARRESHPVVSPLYLEHHPTDPPGTTRLGNPGPRRLNVCRFQRENPISPCFPPPSSFISKAPLRFFRSAIRALRPSSLVTGESPFTRNYVNYVNLTSQNAADLHCNLHRVLSLMLMERHLQLGLLSSACVRQTMSCNQNAVVKSRNCMTIREHFPRMGSVSLACSGNIPRGSDLTFRAVFVATPRNPAEQSSLKVAIPIKKTSQNETSQCTSLSRFEPGIARGKTASHAVINAIPSHGKTSKLLHL